MSEMNWEKEREGKETRVKVEDLLEKQALIGEDGAAAGAGAFACEPVPEAPHVRLLRSPPSAVSVREVVM